MRALFTRLVLFSLASYGLLYFSYKFLIPWSGTNDFQHYYKMDVAPLDFSVAPSPFVLRQVSAVLTHLVWKLHIYYPNEIWFQDPAYDQHVFFAALFVNWVCLVVTAVVAGSITEELLGESNMFATLTAGFLCILSFHTQFVVISGITEGVSWLMLALAFLAYLRHAEWAVVLVLVLSIFQREALLVAVGCLAAFDPRRSTFPLAGFRARVIGYACLSFAIYVLLRRAVPGNNHQVELAEISKSLQRVHFSRSMLTLSFLNQNVAMIALLARRMANHPLAGESRSAGWLWAFLGTFVVVAFGALCAGLDVDIGRIAGITIPLFAASAAFDLTRAYGASSVRPGKQTSRTYHGS